MSDGDDFVLFDWKSGMGAMRAGDVFGASIHQDDNEIKRENGARK